MKIILSILIMINVTYSFGQRIELYGGANKNIFHDFDDNGGHFRSSYHSDVGFTAGVGLDSIKIDRLTLQFILQLDKYGGKLKANQIALGGSSITVANVEKLIISLGIFPLNFKLIKRVNLNFGIMISRLINDSFNGISSGWVMNHPNWSYNLQDKFKRYSSLTYFGFQGRISYDIKLSKSIWLSPQYMYYFGLSNEFVEFPTKSMKHYFCMGIKKKIK